LEPALRAKIRVTLRQNRGLAGVLWIEIVQPPAPVSKLAEGDEISETVGVHKLIACFREELKSLTTFETFASAHSGKNWLVAHSKAY
jgi:hypothetical protein